VADAVGALTGRTHYDAVARDTVATILNDLATVGGSPLCLTAYWASGSSEWFGNEARLADLVEGWSSACRDAGCSWGGGETQALPDIIDPSAVVLGGSAVGTISPKEYLLVGSRVRAGDSMLVAPAVGIHANGLTLARRVASDLAQGWATLVPGDPLARCYGEVLLDPAPLYGPLVEAVQRSGVTLHYAAHVTGHGWQKVMRASRQLTYVIERLPAIPPVLDLIVQTAELTPRQSYTTFNMGAGFILFLPSAGVPTAIAVAASRGYELFPIGHVEDGPKRVVLQPLGLELSGDSLRIR
jgi:phosphoribosylformylglycinamidine cyclo-ligase